MLSETFKENELLFASTVNGVTSDGTSAFRGDLVVTLGDMHEASKTRNPPKCLCESATYVADDNGFLFFAGSLEKMEDIPLFFEVYGKYISADITVILYVVNAKDNMLTEYNGVKLAIRPYEESTVWMLLMEDLYVEKSDLKGQSAEDKVVTMLEASKDFKPKDTEFSFEDACANTQEASRTNFGAV